MVKTCKKCGEEKSLDQFQKDSYKKDGLRNDCKDCSKIRRKKYYDTHKENAIMYNMEYIKNNPEKHKIWTKTCRENNKEKYNKQSLKWYYNNRATAIKRKKLYRKQNKEKVSIYRKQWQQNNKDLIILYSQKRRALKISSDDGTITLENCNKILKQQNYKCVYCRCELTDKNKTIEHKIPLSKGGIHSIDNINYACGSCNSKKYTKTHEEYLKEITLK